MDTKTDTIMLLDQLIEAMNELNMMWDEIETWSDANLEPVIRDAA